MRRIVLIGVAALFAVSCTGDDDAGPADRLDLSPDADILSVPFEGFDGRTVTLADYAGRPLVVNLFASWCAPCVAEMPAIEAVKQDVGDEVAFLGIAVNDRLEDARALVERTGVTWDLARDPQGELTTGLGAVGMPTTYLVSADGEVVEQHTGELTGDRLRELLRDRLGVQA